MRSISTLAYIAAVRLAVHGFREYHLGGARRAPAPFNIVGEDNMATSPIASRDEAEARLVERAIQDEQFRSLLLSDPRAAAQQELGIDLPTSVRLHVLQESPSDLYMVLPLKPAALKGVIADDELSETELEHVSGGMCTCGDPY
jgi:hypothetical protein